MICNVHHRLMNKSGLPKPAIFPDPFLSFTPTSSPLKSPVSCTEIFPECPSVTWAKPPSHLAGTTIVVSSLLFPFPSCLPAIHLPHGSTWQLEWSFKLLIRSRHSLVKSLQWLPLALGLKSQILPCPTRLSVIWLHCPLPPHLVDFSPFWALQPRRRWALTQREQTFFFCFKIY